MKPVLIVENVGKRYRSGEHVTPPYRSLKHEIEDVLSRCRGKTPALRPSKELVALKDVSFSVGRGEFLGIIGKNGSGKSTLVRVIAGITKPTEGTVTVHGDIGILAGTGLGMHHELTGRENIVVAGGIMGLSRRAIDERMENIVAFSELQHALDTPVKFYSSGMCARLAFSVSIHLDHPDILLIDEVLAAGDLAFMQKCLAKLEALHASGMTIIFVSHSLGHVRMFANRCLYLHEGRIAGIGDPGDVIAQYHSDLHLDDHKREMTAQTKN